MIEIFYLRKFLWAIGITKLNDTLGVYWEAVFGHGLSSSDILTIVPIPA